MGSSVPEAQRLLLAEEPRWVDLQFERDEEHLDLRTDVLVLSLILRLRYPTLAEGRRIG